MSLIFWFLFTCYPVSLLTNASVALVPASSSPETHGRPSLEALGLELSDYKFHTHGFSGRNPSLYASFASWNKDSLIGSYVKSILERGRIYKIQNFSIAIHILLHFKMLIKPKESGFVGETCYHDILIEILRL